MTVKVKLPKNVRQEEMELFMPFLSYDREKLKVLFLKDVLVSYLGLAFMGNALIPQSNQRYRGDEGRIANDLIKEHYEDIVNNPENIMSLEEHETYLTIHHPYSTNYWHWITESILRVWLVREKCKTMTLILPDYCPDVPFILDSLKPFKFKDIFFIPKGKHLFVKSVCLPQIKPVMDSYYKTELLQISKFYKEFVGVKNGTNTCKWNRLYLSRQKADKRRVNNEDEVVCVLKKYGFNVINNEDYSFYEQISLFSNATHVFSIHGAGLTNMLFMNENSVVLEMHKRKTNSTDWHSFAFWYLADALNLQYYHQICEPLDPSASFFAADLTVNIMLLEQNCQMIFGY